MQGKSTCWLWMLLLLFSTGCWLGGMPGVYGQSIPEEVIIDNGGYNTDIYEKVQFNHGSHTLDYGISCRKCHHTWDQREKSAPGKCPDCHGLRDKEKLPLRDAYMNKCRGCHGSYKMEGKPSGPTRCNGCHEKKKRLP